jgi:hypothetical protein
VDLDLATLSEIRDLRQLADVTGKSIPPASAEALLPRARSGKNAVLRNEVNKSFVVNCHTTPFV